MNRTRFRLLVFFMSLSLIGIILVQLYWVNLSLKNSEEQFAYQIHKILIQVSERVKTHREDKIAEIKKANLGLDESDVSKKENERNRTVGEGWNNNGEPFDPEKWKGKSDSIIHFRGNL